MSIFNNAQVQLTHRQRFNDFSVKRPVMELDAVQTGRVADTIDKSAEYVLQLRLMQNFWANPAQRDSARKVALHALASYLYEDVLREIPHLILAIESGDREEAIDAALRIKQATQP